jgi:hypothetical protein
MNKYCIRQDPVSPNSKGRNDFNNKHDTEIKTSSNDNDLGNELKLNNNINQKAVSACPLTAPFYGIQLSK